MMPLAADTVRFLGAMRRAKEVVYQFTVMPRRRMAVLIARGLRRRRWRVKNE